MAKDFITRKEIVLIEEKDMREYIKTIGQARRWHELTHNRFEFEVEFKNGAKTTVNKKLIFEVARKRFFDEFYNVGTDPRPMEGLAEEILREFEERETA